MICVYDIETYPNIFTFVFRELTKQRKLKIFEISSRKNDLPELISYLKQNLMLIGYNCLYFDYPILHYILEHPNCTLDEMYNYVQTKIIGSDYPAIQSWNIKIPQCDLFKINHYDNVNRSTSLKWLEFTLRWKKLQDLPFKPGTIIPESDFDFLIEYNINDVDFTEVFFNKCRDAVTFREQMSKVLNHNVMNYSDVKIGEYLNRITYSRLSGIEYKDFKYGKTKRNIIKVSQLIPGFISFKTPELKNFLSDIRTKSFHIDDDFERHITLGKMSIKFAKGGLHSEDKPGIIVCKEGYNLKEKDVGSMYPKAIIAGNYYPQHLGPTWNQGIKLLYDERLDELKPQLKKLKYKSPEYNFIDSKQNAYKLAMNGGGYGKTGSEFSWQYDPMVMLKVTFRGQLSLLMLLEEYYLMGLQLISANTDGIVIHYPQDIENKVQEIHDKWEVMTDSILEDTYYKQIINRDVNNYIAEIIDGNSRETIKFKYKGCFEIDQEPHKNNSQRIVAIALKEYFISKIPIKDVIHNLGYNFVNSKGKKETTTIFDYCKGVKRSSKTHGYSFISPEGREDISDKVVRFYISNTKTKMYKLYDDKDERVAAVSKGFHITPFMNYVDKKDYKINYAYYINECLKIINPIKKQINRGDYEEPEQLKLF
jgi:hypothetical protein